MTSSLRTSEDSTLDSFSSSGFDKVSRQILHTDDDEVCICALATHFNPTLSARRHKNFHLFAQKLRQQGVYLITVELYADSPLLNGSEVSDFYRSIQLDNYTAKYPLWQKERLLNVGLELLDSPEMPVSCKNVAWIDGEILFKNDKWVESTCEALESNFTAVQPYEYASKPPRRQCDALIQRAEKKRGKISFPSVKNKAFDFEDRGEKPKELTGYAWVANKKKLSQIKFYDRGVIGGGDSFFLSAVQNDYSSEDFNTTVISAGALKVPKLIDHYKKWAENVYTVFENKIGFPVKSASSPVLHLWHGDATNRRYASRWEILQEHDFNPETDVVETEQGFLSWSESLKNDEKRGKLINSVHRYFEMRLEDETDKKRVLPLRDKLRKKLGKLNSLDLSDEKKKALRERISRRIAQFDKRKKEKQQNDSAN